MKNSVLASLLFGALAVAAPVNKRDLAYKTEIVTETVVVYTTVWEDDTVAEATTTPAGYFYEQPAASSSVVASSTPAQAPTPAPAAQKPSSAYVAPAPQAPSPTPAPAPAASPSPAPAPAPVEQPKPVEQSPSPAAQQPQQPATSAYVPPAAPTTTQAAAPVATTPASAPSSNQPSGGSSGATYSNVDMTIYDNNGGFGACGTELHDSDMIVALAKDAWGASTYDVMTGQATNPWCGQKIKIDYNGNSIIATIMDLCPGCSGHDIDLSLNAWKSLTGMDEKTRLKASWSKVS